MIFQKIVKAVTASEIPDNLDVVFVDINNITHKIGSISIDCDSDCYPQLIRLLEKRKEKPKEEDECK